MNTRAVSPVLTIGEALVSRVEELRIPNKISYFTQNEALIAANRPWLQPHFLDEAGHFDLVFQSWIVEVDDRIVLIDPCTGNGKPHSVPFFDMLDVPWIERMDATGYRPHDVDFVVCTHLHHDHCGWNTQLRGGKWVPTFPNARYVIQQAEYERWKPGATGYPAFAYNDGVFEQSIQPVVEAGLAELISGSRRLTPGVEVEPAPGHTLAHQMVHLESSGRHAYFTGDTFHHPIQLVEPGLPFGDAENPAEVEAMRRRLVELSLELDAPLIAAHAQAPYTVRAYSEGGETRFACG